MMARCSKFTSLLVCHPWIAEAVVNRHISALQLEATTQDSSEFDSELSTELRSTLDAMSSSMLRIDGDGPGVADAVKTVTSKMDFQTAVKKVEKKSLPRDVAALVR